MQPIAPELRGLLRSAGVSPGAIEAVWPEWWSSEAEQSLSARAELRFTIARRLGIWPSSLFEGAPRFVWRDDARFKNLGAVNEDEQAILTSFGLALGGVLIAATPVGSHNVTNLSAGSIRDSVLRSAASVGLGQLLAFSWAVGVPIVKTAVYPLPQKRMHAMTVVSEGRFAIILGQDSAYPSRVAFTVAHELGHILLGHVGDTSAFVDIGDPFLGNGDEEEDAADRFALHLLTGTPKPTILSDSREFNATQLAHAARDASAMYGIDAGIIALCVGYETGRWEAATGALKVLGGEEDLSGKINRVAAAQLDWGEMPLGSQGYVENLLGLPHDA